MRFLDSSSDATLVPAVIAWPKPVPLLTDVCALFDQFGLKVAGQQRLSHDESSARELHRFEYVPPPGWNAQSLAHVAQAFAAHETHGFVIDAYARLIIAANVSWRDVVLLRSAARYLRQAGLGLSDTYVVETLQNHPHFVTAFIDCFTARFDPAIEDVARAGTTAAAAAELAARIDNAATVDEDRILRALGSFVTATLRTNWFQPTAGGAAKPYASFMLDSAQIYPRGPVVPFREIFVASDHVEGIHLRGGPIARGGLRFSDRPEDYRTEVLSLMKTQTVKNSLIVPVGAKGAFIRRGSTVSAEHAYSTFVAGLLDVTDNLVDARMVAPSNTVIYGGDDGYLVVAADKGTARFSDLANELAIDRRYWLGDAFASGGSAGYDHKTMGITARGAWVSVGRHFAELGVDADNDPIRVVGIGDMSGDVFGNGMLLGRGIRLVAAFDHRHIFIDPNPDASTGYAERRRLFELPTSSWADYDRSKLSAGGGIWPRNIKSISLSQPASAVVGLTTSTVTPTELISSILRADVDLLWNGGIGTYVKSAAESNTDAADPANDLIRVDADQLKVKVIGEGGNLGLTQRARVDYALAGGRLNADFIDNAAGVATSDREVNLKIAMAAASRAGRMTRTERDHLLTEARDEVAAAVLRECDDQVLAISLAEAQASHLLNRHQRLIETLERNSGINRTTEELPSRAQLISRTRAGRGLTRPEIAVLLAHSKNVVRDELLSSDLPDEPVFRDALSSYFPRPVREAIPVDIARHRLYREIIATKIAGDLINHVGPGLIYQLEERLGVPSSAVAAAYAVVRELFEIDAVWESARQEVRISDPHQWDSLHKVQQFIEYAATRLLRRDGGSMDVGVTIERYRNHIQALKAWLPSVDIQFRDMLCREAFDLSETAARLNFRINRVAQAYLEVGQELELSWIAKCLEEHTSSSWWDAMAAAAVRDEIADNHHRLTAAVLGLRAQPGEMLNVWRAQTTGGVERFIHMRAEIGRDGLVDVARASTVNAELILLCRQTERLVAQR